MVVLIYPCEHFYILPGLPDPIPKNQDHVCYYQSSLLVFPQFYDNMYLFLFFCYCNFATNLCIFTRPKYFCSLLFERIYNRISLGLFVFYIVHCSLVTVHAPMFHQGIYLFLLLQISLLTC